MNQEHDPTASEGSTPGQPSLASSNQARPLRIWPAIVLLATLWAMKLVPGLFEASVPGFMISAFGPVLVAILIILWWLLWSRATGREKLIGAAGIVLIALMSYFTAHETVRGLGIIVSVIPWGFTTFTAALILLARWSSSRISIALCVTLCVVGFWSLVRVDGIWGDFKSTRNWRWTPTAEDQYLAMLATSDRQPSGTNEAGSIEGGRQEDLTPEVTTAEWPAFRGPNRDGQAPNVVLDPDFTAHPPKEIWRIRVGPGWSSFSVAGHRLFTQEQRGDDEAVVCLDARTGKELWAHLYPARFYEVVGGAGPRATPTWDGGRLFCLGAQGMLMRLDPVTGESVWTSDLRKDAEREPPTWGFSSSPLVIHDLIVVHAGGSGDKGLLAYDAETGQKRWGAPAGDHSYSSPQSATIDGQLLVLEMTNTGLTAADPDSGSVLFDYAWNFEGGYRVIQPLLVSGTQVLLGTGLGVGTRKIELSKVDSSWQPTEVWTTRDMKPYFNDYVVQGDYLYGFDHNIFACVDLQTGKRAWKKGRYGSGQVLSLPDAHQLLVLSETGDVHLLAANPKSHEELGSFPALSGKTWNHPVLVGNRLYLRNGEEAACFELATAELQREE